MENDDVLVLLVLSEVLLLACHQTVWASLHIFQQEISNPTVGRHWFAKMHLCKGLKTWFIESDQMQSHHISESKRHHFWSTRLIQALPSGIFWHSYWKSLCYYNGKTHYFSMVFNSKLLVITGGYVLDLDEARSAWGLGTVCAEVRILSCWRPCWKPPGSWGLRNPGHSGNLKQLKQLVQLVL